MRPKLTYTIPGLTAQEVDDFHTLVMGIDVLIKGIQEEGNQLVVELDMTLAGKAEQIKQLERQVRATIISILGAGRQLSLNSAG
jgi:hypothetical protein